jgi:hypothetical protein
MIVNQRTGIYFSENNKKMDTPEIYRFHSRALTREGRTVPAYGQRYPEVRRNLEEAVGTAKVLNANKRLGTAVDKKIASTTAAGGRLAEDGVLHVADLLADRVGEEVALHLQDGVGADLRLRLDCAVTQARLVSYNQGWGPQGDAWSILADQSRPRIRVQMRGGGCGVSANVSCAHHVTWSPK